MKRTIMLILSSFLLAGCASALGLQHIMPGYISETESLYDQSTIVKMVPARLMESPGGLRLGMYWTPEMKDSARLIVRVYGIHAFSIDSPLHFKVDGEELTLPPVEEMDTGKTHSEYNQIVGMMSWSLKDYLITRQTIDKLLSAKMVYVKAFLSDSYVDGRFSMTPDDTNAGSPEYAVNAFSAFRDRTWRRQTQMNETSSISN